MLGKDGRMIDKLDTFKDWPLKFTLLHAVEKRVALFPKVTELK